MSNFYFILSPNLLQSVLGQSALMLSVSINNMFFKLSRYRPELALRVDRGIAPPFRNLGARTGWVVSTTARPLYPRERPGTHCTGGWVGPRAGLGVCEKSHPHRDSVPGPSSP
jgi:hypothetical protein